MTKRQNRIKDLWIWLISFLIGLVISGTAYLWFFQKPILSLRSFGLAAVVFLFVIVIARVGIPHFPSFLPRKELAYCFLIGIGLAAGLVFFIARPSVFYFLLPQHSFQVIIEDNPNPESKGNHIDFHGFRTGSGYLSFNTIEISPNWTRGDKIISSDSPSSYLVWTGQPYEEMTLVFESGPRAGKVKITFDGSSPQFIDFYSPAVHETIVSHNTPTPFIIKVFSTGVVLTSLSTLLSTLFILLLLIQQKYLINRRYILLGLFALGGIGAALLMGWTMKYGPSVMPDSDVYLDTAANLLAGKGFWAGGQPGTHFPPTYPLLLAVAGFFKQGDIFGASRWLSAFLFGVNIVLVGIAVKICIRNSLTAVAGGMLIFLSSDSIITYHSSDLSEPAFIAFALTAMILLAQYIQSRRLILLVLSALAVGLAVTTRYIGMVLLPVMISGLLLLGDQPRTQKFKDAILMALIACVPLGAWLVRNMLVTQAATDRVFVAHWISPQQISSFFTVLNDMFLPSTLPIWVKNLEFGIAAALLIAAFARLYLHRENAKNPGEFSTGLNFISLGFLFCIFYAVSLGVSISFFDAATQIFDRLLLPVFVILIPVAVGLAWSFSLDLNKPWIWWGVLFCIFLSVGWNASFAIPKIMAIHQEGYGDTALKMQEAKSLALIKSISQGQKIYSNDPHLIHFAINLETSTIPNHTISTTNLPNSKYKELIQQMCSEDKTGKARVVYFTAKISLYLPTLDQLKSECDLPFLIQTEDMVVFGK